MGTKMTDPMEDMIRSALDECNITYTEDGKLGGEINKALDFYLTDFSVHIEVKQFHSPRIANQMARVDNVIVAQGRVAVELLADMLKQWGCVTHDTQTQKQQTYIIAVKALNEAAYTALRAARDTVELPMVNRQLLRNIAHLSDNLVNAGLETASEETK